MKWLLKLLGLTLSPEEKKILDAANRKAAEMAKYGGRMVISDSGGIRDEFETEKGSAQYYRAIIKRAMKED
ncbi:hypothetical protein ACOKQT_17935 [Vibrio cholerae]|uniref:hypothetical protein n=1 Tax=Vibrio cholerae TaxID=666 RepID=UPI0020592502|nr:hypothetical protein 1992IndM4_0785 [Vibrio phage ICP1]